MIRPAPTPAPFARALAGATLALFVAACSEAGPVAPAPSDAFDAAELPLTQPVASAPAGPTFLFGFRNANGAVERLDIPSGARNFVGLTGFSGASGMGTTRAPVTVGATSWPEGTHVGMIAANSVIAVDTETGGGTLIVNTSRTIGGRGVAFGPDGKTLYLLETSGALSTIDLATGAVTLVANTVVRGSSLEWDPVSGTFYALYSSRLWNIRPDGLVLASVPLSLAIGTPCTLARWPDTGEWFTMTTSGLYSMQLDGTVTRVGTTNLGGLCGTAFAPEKVINEPPSGVDAGGPYTGLEGSPVSFTGAGSDPAGEPVTFEWDFGDGSPVVTGQNPTHTYADDGSYTVTLIVRDPSGLGTVDVTAATIGNVAPTIESLTPPALAGDVDVALSTVLAFSDPGTGDTFVVDVDWGDGTVESIARGDQSDVGLAHTYTAGGTYNGSVTVTDDDGGSASVTFVADVIEDATPPEISVVANGTLGNDGWFTSDVDVVWTVTDPDSPVTIDAGCVDATVDADTHGDTFSCAASSDGGSATGAITVKRDATAPVVSVVGNLGTYDAAAEIDISCTATDATSGIDADGCVSFSGPAYAFGLGTTTFSAGATDVAGNETTVDRSFTVSASFDGTCALVERFVSHHGVANSLCAKLRAAAKAKNDNARRGSLTAFIHEVEAQTGKKIDPADAAVLILLAGSLM